jgi:hypothetical protein
MGFFSGAGMFLKTGKRSKVNQGGGRCEREGFEKGERRGGDERRVSSFVGVYMFKSPLLVKTSFE